MGLLDRIAGTLEGLGRDADADADERANQEIDAAMTVAGAGDLATAEDRLRTVTEARPRLARGFKRLGEVRARRGAHDDAASAYGRAVDLDADDIDAWFELGELLARLGRFEPARDALRRALTLSIDPAERGRAHAALGRLYGGHAAAGKAARELGKAVKLLPGDHALAAEYGRALVRTGDPGAAEWLTRAALAPGADPTLVVDAAAVTTVPADAERLLREARVRLMADGAPGVAAARGAVTAALSRQLTRSGQRVEARNLALEAVTVDPASAAALAALRESYAAAGEWREALATARRETEMGGVLSVEDRLALALGARDRAALSELASAGASAAHAPPAGLASVLTGLERFLHNAADESDLIALAAFAPDAESQRFVVEGLAPAAAPAGNLVALLGYAHELAVRTPELWPLVVPAARALEAYDRPLLVAVMGEFNAGKSSFVNALCGEEIAPVGVTPTTATINILRHGPMGGRASYHDGHVHDLDAPSVAPFLRGLGVEEAAAIRVVEIFYPLEVLRRVEVVDTPGLNSLRPEHESVARDFLVDADAIVWLFAVGQAAKATEKQALALAQAAGKRVLGVLNKIDRASDEEIGQVSAHVAASLGDLVEAVVPISARRGLEAKRVQAGAGGADANEDKAAKKARATKGGSASDDGGFAALEATLEQRFFRHARALKRDTALGALRRFVAEARIKTVETSGAGSAPASAARSFADERRALTAAEHRVRGALAGERIRLRARIDETYRSAAFEVREFVRPRSWLFGEHRAEAADEEFLIDLLDEAIGRATEQTRAALAAALKSEDATTPTPAPFAGAFERACERALERFQAYARGVLEGGAVAEFFRHDLPRIRLDLGAIRNALARRAPDPEEVLFRALDRETRLILARARRDLDRAEATAAIGALIRSERVERPLAQVAEAVEALAHEDPARAGR